MFPVGGTWYSVYGYRVDISSSENACAVPVPGKPPSRSAIGINGYDCAAGHSYVIFLRTTAEKQELVREEDLLACEGCSIASRRCYTPSTQE